MQNEMADSDGISSEPDIKEDISSLIKEEQLNEEPYKMQDKMADSDGISSEPDIKEDLSSLIKEEQFNEEFCIKDDPDDAGAVKIEQDVTAMIVPKVEGNMSPSKSYENFGRDVNEGAKNVFDNITGFLKNDVSGVKTEDSALYSQPNDEGILNAPSRYNLCDKNQESLSSTCEEVTIDCKSLDVFSPSYIEKFSCNECGKSFATHEMLKNHQKVHSRELSYDSDISRPSITRKCVHRTRENVHVGGQLVFACDKCNRSFDSYLGSQIHKGHCGKVSKSCCCDELGIPCSFKSSNRNNQSANLPFCCCVCGKYFRLRKSLMNHVVTHSDERSYHCAVCGQGFKSRMGLIRHLAVHNNVKSYTCTVCSKDFRRKYDLKLHMLTHSEQRPYTCNECGRGFKSRQVLVEHSVTHNKIKQFTCNSCSKDFRSRKAFYDHIMYTHSVEKKYTCNECDRKFNCRKAFIRHLDNHKIAM